MPHHHRTVFAALISALLLLAACAAPTAPVAAPATAVAAPEAASGESAAAPGEAQDIVSWYYYDQDNTDPAANERVGNFYLAETIPQFNEQFAGKYHWVNVPRDYNLVLDLVTAVQNNGDIPDVMRTGTADIPTFVLNNTVQDLTDYVTNAPWYGDLDPKAVEACTAPDGKITVFLFRNRPIWSTIGPSSFRMVSPRPLTSF